MMHQVHIKLNEEFQQWCLKFFQRLSWNWCWLHWRFMGYRTMSPDLLAPKWGFSAS